MIPPTVTEEAEDKPETMPPIMVTVRSPKHIFIECKDSEWSIDKPKVGTERK